MSASKQWPGAWKLKDLPDGVAEPIAEHVTKLREIAEVAAESLNKAAREFGLGNLSKQLNAERRTHWGDVDEKLYKAAEAKADGRQRTLVNLEKLRELHTDASKAWDAETAARRRKVSAAVGTDRPSQTFCSRCGAEADTENEDGGALDVSTSAATTLPVPQQRGDRQARDNTPLADTVEFAGRAIAHSDEGHLEEVLAALLHGRSGLAPHHSAAAVDYLHVQEHPELAHHLGITFGRDEPPVRVMAFTHALIHDHARVEDAELALASALRSGPRNPG